MGCLDTLALFELGKQKIGGGVAEDGSRSSGDADASATGTRMVMGRDLKESGKERARAPLSLSRTGLIPFRQSSSSQVWT